ncbi:hypothetical protein T492DRAFT_343448 [Pavlovales sp. CCMP2436]|nr:hypothetical protein T492DRAFT_343448 [Pavlovales sp. CCMP2436]
MASLGKGYFPPGPIYSFYFITNPLSYVRVFIGQCTPLPCRRRQPRSNSGASPGSHPSRTAWGPCASARRRSCWEAWRARRGTRKKSGWAHSPRSRTGLACCLRSGTEIIKIIIITIIQITIIIKNNNDNI